MNKHPLQETRRVLLSLLLVVGVMLLVFVFSSRAPEAPAAGAPITSIVRTSSGPAFTPSSMTIYLAHTSAIEVDNTTNWTRSVVDARGQLVLKLAPHSSGLLHFTTTGTFVYHLLAHAGATFTALVE